MRAVSNRKSSANPNDLHQAREFQRRTRRQAGCSDSSAALLEKPGGAENDRRKKGRTWGFPAWREQTVPVRRRCAQTRAEEFRQNRRVSIRRFAARRNAVATSAARRIPQRATWGRHNFAGESQEFRLRSRCRDRQSLRCPRFRVRQTGSAFVPAGQAREVPPARQSRRAA